MANEERIDELEKQVAFLTKQLVNTNNRLIRVMGYLNAIITILDEVDSRAINDDLKMLGFIKGMMSTETNKES